MIPTILPLLMAPLCAPVMQDPAQDVLAAVKMGTPAHNGWQRFDVLFLPSDTDREEINLSMVYRAREGADPEWMAGKFTLELNNRIASHDFLSDNIAVVRDGNCAKIQLRGDRAVAGARITRVYDGADMGVRVFHQPLEARSDSGPIEAGDDVAVRIALRYMPECESPNDTPPFIHLSINKGIPGEQSYEATFRLTRYTHDLLEIAEDLCGQLNEQGLTAYPTNPCAMYYVIEPPTGVKIQSIQARTLDTRMNIGWHLVRRNGGTRGAQSPNYYE